MNRRQFTQIALLSGSALALGACARFRMLRNMMSDGPDTKEPVDPARDDLARGIEYVAEVPKDHPAYGKGICISCKYYRPDAEKGGYGRCTLLSSGLVAAGGWCNLWKPISS